MRSDRDDHPTGTTATDGGPDDGANPLAVPRRRETLRVLAGRRLLAALEADDGGDTDERVVTDDDGGDTDERVATDDDGDGTRADGATVSGPGAVVVETETLVGEVVARERGRPGRGSGGPEHHETVASALRSDHLPALDAAGVVSYDPDAGTVRYDGDPGVEARLHLR